MKKTKIDLDIDFELRENKKFAKSFYRSVFVIVGAAIVIAYALVIGLLVFVTWAEDQKYGGLFILLLSFCLFILVLIVKKFYDKKEF